MPPKSKYRYPKHILRIQNERKRRAAMQKFVTAYKKDRTLQRIRNLGRIPFCPICQEPVYKKQLTAKQVVFCEADARHQCHYECWREWAGQNYAETTCPMCRHPYTDLNLKMEVMKYAGTYEIIGWARADPEDLSMDDHGGWSLKMRHPFCYDYSTFTVEVRTDNEYEEDKDFKEWQLSDFKHIFYSLDMMSLRGGSPNMSNILDGEKYYNIQKLLAAARRRKPALLQLGIPDRWATQMLQSVYATLKENVGRLADLSGLLRDSDIRRNIAPFDKIHLWAMGCQPERALRSVPAKKISRAIGFFIDRQGDPKKFVLSTKSGKPFDYDVDQMSNSVTLHADDAQCKTTDGKILDEYKTFKIDMGLQKKSFRSSEQLQTFHLGCKCQNSSEESSSNPWLAPEWSALVARTMVTLVFDDGSEGHYAQNEMWPDSDDDSDSDNNSDDDSDDNDSDDARQLEEEASE